MKNPTEKNSKLAVGGFFLVLSTLTLLGYSFFPVWRNKHAEGAQAYGAFLQFVAASLATIITLLYVFYTRKSLDEAQRANDLLRTQWERSQLVNPKLWLALSGREREWHQINFDELAPFGGYEHARVPQLVGCIWNSGSQSFRVVAVRCWLAGDPSLRFEQRTPGLVVSPHAVEEVDITIQVVALLYRFTQPQSKYAEWTLTRPNVEIACSLVYEAWDSEGAMTSPISVLIRTDEGIGNILLVNDLPSGESWV